MIGANVIEKVSHLVDRILQTGWAVNLDLPDERFDPTKEALDLAVAPGGSNRNALMTNADQLQEGLEHRAFEDQLVVSADGVGFAESTLITTNKSFAEWSEVFPNAACVVALIDRLIHHAEIVSIQGSSYRHKEAQERAAGKQTRRKKTGAKS